MTVTMVDVARYAAVSTATVSRVINSPEMVNQETRERVQAAIQALNYHINVTARNLRTRRTNNLAVVVPHLKNPLVTEILEALEKAALMQGYTTQLCLTYGELERVQKYATLLAEKRRIDGVFAFASTLIPDMIDMVYTVSRNTPVLLANHALSSIPGILFDYRQAVYRATKFLIESGHRRIALFNLPVEYCYPARMRLEGYRKALEEADLPEELIFEAPLPDEYKVDWHEIVSHMIETRPTAVLAYDDRVAATIYQVCAACGIRIPDDLSVIGCGDFPVAKLLQPALTTISFPTEMMGQQAFASLYNHINEAPLLNGETSYLPVAFIQRDSAC